MNRGWYRILATMLAATLGPTASVCAAEDAAGLEFFEAKVRPLLAENCFECHGAKKQKSHLRLDHISTILKGGERGPAVVRGEVGKSRIVEAVRYEDPDLQMPPKKKLREEQIAVLERWVEMGAVWPDEPAPGEVVKEEKGFDLEGRKAEHWAWRPIQVGPPPDVSDAKWPVNDIDRYVLAKLDEAGLKPAPDADKRTWLRRVCFDLTGLPPTPGEVEAFVADDSPRAYEKVVDGLLQSPRFGERWARHWLDLVRYAETYGHEFDFPIAEAWRYRDYVIRALNADVPYDQFVTEHLASDLLEKPRVNPDEGFNESVIATGFWYFHEQSHSPTDVRQHESDRIDNQIDIMSKAFLGLTLACARCHDHKFDAISTKDYYALAGFMRSSRQQYALLDPGGKIEGIAGQLRAMRGEKARGLEPLGLKSPDIKGNWSTTGWAFVVENGVAHSGLLAEKLRGVLRSPTFTITQPKIFLRIAGRGGKARVIIDSFTMDALHPHLFAGLIVPVNTDGKFVWHTIEGDYGRYLGHRAHIEVIDEGEGWVALDEVRFGDGAPPPGDPQPQFAPITEAMRQLGKTLPAPIMALAVTDGSGEDSPVYVRGSYKIPGDIVPRRFLEALDGSPRLSGASPTGSGRLELARRILDDSNPFPARVAVNRLWHHLFGRGIVPTVDNFGVLGEKPSHPELLDYLADRFRREGWSQKAMIRQIVLSRTYRQSSAIPQSVIRTPHSIDPTNVLLHRMNVRRLEGEAIRDAVLAVSGRLDETMYGPPVAVHLTPFMEGRGRPGQSGPLDGDGRRSIYLEVRRNFLPPMMLAFDTPTPFTAFGRRTVSNVPAQALTMMNDPFVVEQAMRWAKRVIDSPHLSGASQRITAMYLTAFSRPPTEEERATAEAFIRAQADLLGPSTGDPMNREQAWADLAHVLLNTKEFIFLQ